MTTDLKTAIENYGKAFEDVTEALKAEHAEIWNKVHAYFDEDEHLTAQWLATKIPSLGNERPCDLMIQSDFGCNKVKVLIDRLISGDV